MIGLLAGATVQPVDELWTSGTLVAASGADVSPWLDLTLIESLLLARTATGGAYALEIDWSRDGATADVTEAITLANNTSTKIPAATRFARVRVRNTDGVAAFTAHRTTVHGR